MVKPTRHTEVSAEGPPYTLRGRLVHSNPNHRIAVSNAASSCFERSSPLKYVHSPIFRCILSGSYYCSYNARRLQRNIETQESLISSSHDYKLSTIKIFDHCLAFPKQHNSFQVALSQPPANALPTENENRQDPCHFQSVPQKLLNRTFIVVHCRPVQPIPT